VWETYREPVLFDLILMNGDLVAHDRKACVLGGLPHEVKCQDPSRAIKNCASADLSLSGQICS